MVSEAQRKANKKWTTTNSDYLNSVAREKWAERYAQKGDILRQQAKESYERNKVKKLAHSRLVYTFKTSAFGELCAIY